MSNINNDNLTEEARELQEYWAGTMHADLIQQALDEGDLQQLAFHVSRAKLAQHDVEYQPDEEPLTDEQIAKIASEGRSVQDGDIF